MADPIGRAHVEIGADTTKLEQGVANAKAKTEQMGNAGAEAGRKMGKGLDGAVKSASRLQSAFSKLFIPVAVFASVSRLITMLRSLQEQGAKTRKAMDDVFSGAQSDAMQNRRRNLTDLAKSLAELNDQERAAAEGIRKVFQENADPEKFSGLIQTIFGNTNDYDQAIKRLQNVYKELRTAAIENNRQVLDDTRKRLDAEVLSAQSALAEIEAAELDRQGRFEQAAQKRAEALGAAYLNELQSIRQAEKEFESIFGMSGEQFRFMRQALEALHALRMKQVRDEAKEAGEAYKSAMSDAIKQVQAEIFNGFGFDFTSMEQVAAAGDRIAAAIDRNGGLR